MWIRMLSMPGIALQSYIVGDSTTGQVVVIDPPRSLQPLLLRLQQEKLRVRYILETHVHTDFISGAKELQERLMERPPIVCSGFSSVKDSKWIPFYANVRAEEGYVLNVGSMRFEALHTPGHTPEHITWVLYDLERSGLIPFAAFTGDLLFPGSVGRPDLLGKSDTPALLDALHDSLFVKLAALPDSLLIYPAHGQGTLCGKHVAESGITTLGYERKVNPYLQAENKDVWKKSVLESMTAAPLLFEQIKKQNLTGIVSAQQVLNLQELPLEQLKVKPAASTAQYLDVRLPALFAFGHLPGFVNITLTPQFLYWILLWRNPNVPLYVVASDKKELEYALEQLALIGIEKIDGYFYLDESGAKKAMDALVTIPYMTPVWAEHLRTQQNGHFCLLDVRLEKEREAARIPGSLGVSLQDLLQDPKNSLEKIPKGMPIVVLCRTGSRSSCAASLLQATGIKEVSVLNDGMEAWKKEQLPVEGFLDQDQKMKNLSSKGLV